jgi:hypothetical protein
MLGAGPTSEAKKAWGPVDGPTDGGYQAVAEACSFADEDAVFSDEPADDDAFVSDDEDDEAAPDPAFALGMAASFPERESVR